MVPSNLVFTSDAIELLAEACRREDGRLRDEMGEHRSSVTSASAPNGSHGLTDAFLDSLLDKETFEVRKTALYGDRRLLRDALEAPYEQPFVDRALEILGRGNMAQSLYEVGLVDEKREIVKSLTSDLRARRKSLQITMRPTFQAILDAQKLGNGAQRRIVPRIMRALEAEQESSAPNKAQRHGSKSLWDISRRFRSPEWG